jgi:phosphoribosyl 1,2-cyclic phosphodiesterase
MQLKFIGVGSAYNPNMGNCNAYFAIEDSLFLIDCGETTFEKIFNLPIYISCQHIIVIITHMHADHIGSLGSLISYSHYVLNKEITIAYPLETLSYFLDLIGIDRNAYRFIKIRLGQLNNLNCNILIEPIIVDHVPDMTCFGYIISTKDYSIYFSGDANSIPEYILNKLKSGQLDKIFQDTTTKITSHPTHATLSYLKESIPLELRSRVYCMHLDSNYKIITDEGFNIVSIDVTVKRAPFLK